MMMKDLTPCPVKPGDDAITTASAAELIILDAGAGNDFIAGITYCQSNHSQKHSFLRTYPLGCGTRTLVKVGEKRCTNTEKNTGKHCEHKKRYSTLTNTFEFRRKSDSGPISVCASSYQDRSESRYQLPNVKGSFA